MNTQQIYITLAILIVILLILIIRETFILINKTRKNKKLTEELNQIHIQSTLYEHRFADFEKEIAKIEAQKEEFRNQCLILEKKLSAHQATTLAKEENLLEKIKYLEQIKEELSLKFQNISSEIIKSQHETFTKEQQQTLSVIINPFAEQLKEFKQEVTSAREESIKHKSNLDAQLANLSQLNQTLSQDAQNLAEALKGGKKAQGNWGECQLSRILEISGLRKGQDYDTQESFHDEDKKLYRPDVIIHLPENRDIIVDSKVSLIDYLDAVNAEDEETRAKCLQKNVQSLKAHIDELSSKEYQKLLKDRSLNYVIMFIPVESAYIAALDSDRYIYDYAYKRNIILATPLSLLPTLRTVENLWRIDSQNQNVQKIAEIGGKIYDKLASFVDDMKTIERGMNQANNAYNNAMTKLSGRGGAISQAEKMKLLGSKTNKSINLALNDNVLEILEKETVEEIDGKTLSKFLRASYDEKEYKLRILEWLNEICK
jgi:DNA recombination protein RmuC